MLTTAHTSAAMAKGSTRAELPHPPAPPAPPAPVGSGSGPTGTALVSSGFQAFGSSGGSEADIGQHYRQRVANWCPLGRLRDMPTATMPITGDPAADELLVTDPLALVIGMLLDQQVPMEWAFRGPATLRDRLGRARLRHDRGDAARGRSKRCSRRSPRCTATRDRWRSAPTPCAMQRRRRVRRRRRARSGRASTDPAVLFAAHPGAPRLRRREGEDLPRHPRQATAGRAEGMGGVRGAVLRRQAALGRRHRLAREPASGCARGSRRRRPRASRRPSEAVDPSGQ